MTTAETEPTPKSAKAGALHRDLGVLDATMLVMGAMIGSGIFITSANRPGWSARPAGCWWPGPWPA